MVPSRSRMTMERLSGIRAAGYLALCLFGEFEPAEQLHGKEHDESRVVLQVALPETTRFGDETIKPFETDAHHPAGRLRFRTRQEIKCRTDAEHDGVNAAAMPGHPEILLGGVESNEKNTSAGVVDGGDDFFILFGGQRAERRREGVGDLKFGEAPGEGGP